MRFEARGSRFKMSLRGQNGRGNLKHVMACVLLCAVAAFAAPKSASAYYSDAAFQYIENRLPTAEITCNEGLQYYPNDQKLQMLLDRIKEAKDEQKNENQKKDPKNDQNDQNQDQNQDKDNQDQNKDQQNQDQNQDQNSGESSSSQGEDQQNQDQNNGGQSSSSSEQSSDSNGGADQQPQQPEEQSSDSQGEQPEMPPEVPEGQMDPADAAQLLKDFDEQNGERKPWKPVRGQARPARDW